MAINQQHPRGEHRDRFFTDNGVVYMKKSRWNLRSAFPFMPCIIPTLVLFMEDSGFNDGLMLNLSANCPCITWVCRVGDIFTVDGRHG